MKKKSTVVFLVAVALIAVMGMAYAAPPLPIADRIANQENRIHQGIAKGELTRGEADTLYANLNYIKERYYRMVSDGTLTPGERKRLEKMLDDNGHMIHQKRLNAIRPLY